MQVSQIAELDTHAVIGGGKAQAFGMSDSAEFFTVLSDTLYRDKKRAVIREVICNAWDAHIMVGKLDVPVEITLNDQELVIKDFGPGIAKDKIGPVYCVYGASTKVRDANQTGGFGLGCKAPFAYSDHFTVTSCHDGFRTLWAISRGGAATDGKPDFRPMVSVPTTETGIAVSIPIKDEKDVKAFTALIKEIVRNGGMLAKLNDELITRFDYTEAREQGFCIVGRYDANAFRESRAYLLYGTVLYPISTTDNELSAKVDALDRLIEGYARMMLIAPPNSVGVTPSREALSYSELTTKTLHGLIDKAIGKLRQVGPGIAHKIYRNHMRETLIDRDDIVISMPSRNNQAFEGLIHDPEMIAERAVRENLGVYLSDTKRDRIALKVLQKKWRDDRRFFRRAGRNWHLSLERESLDRSRKLHLRLASKLGLLGNLHVFTKPYGHQRWSSTPIDEFRATGRLLNRLIIGPTRKAVDAQLRKEMAEFKDRCEAKRHAGALVPALVLANPSERLLEEIIGIADKLKIKTTLLDFPKRKKSAKVGDLYTGLADLRYNTRGYNWRAAAMSIVEPKAYIRAFGTSERLELAFIRYDANGEEVKRIDALFPGIAIVWTLKQEARMKAKKIPMLAEVIAGEIEKLSDSREVQYATMIKGRHFIKDSGYYRSVASFVEKLSVESLAIAKFFFPDRVKVNDKAERLAVLVDLAEKLSRGRNRSDRADAAQTNILMKAKKTFAHLRMTGKEADKKFAYLKPFTGVDYDRENEETLLEIIRFLSRRAAKAAIDPTSTNNLKEAA